MSQSGLERKIEARKEVMRRALEAANIEAANKAKQTPKRKTLVDSLRGAAKHGVAVSKAGFLGLTVVTGYSGSSSESPEFPAKEETVNPMDIFVKSFDIPTEIDKFISEYQDKDLASLNAVADSTKKELKKAFGHTLDFDSFELKGAKLVLISGNNEQDIIYASLILNGKKHSVYGYTSEFGVKDYYTEDEERTSDFINPKPTSGYLSSDYGPRIHPIRKYRHFHSGVDYANFKNTRIKAAADGKVSFAGATTGYGKCIIIEHANGYETVYAHQNKFEYGIKKNTEVKSGDNIGYIGDTGDSTGPHLHFEVINNGAHQDPLTPAYVGQKMSTRDHLRFQALKDDIKNIYENTFILEDIMLLAGDSDKIKAKILDSIEGKSDIETLHFLISNKPSSIKLNNSMQLVRPQYSIPQNAYYFTNAIFSRR